MQSAYHLEDSNHRYNPATLLTTLYNALTPCDNDNSLKERAPMCLVGADEELIVFPPATDGGTDGKIESIEGLIQLAKSHSNLASKKLVFPVSEERVVMGWFGGAPRDHWVTLYYDPTTQKATVIDSRPAVNNYLYALEPLRIELQKGLELIGLKVNSIELQSQGVQVDNIHCGDWTCANIIALANGHASYDELVTRFKAEDKANIILENQCHRDKDNYQNRCQKLSDELSNHVKMSAEDGFTLVEYEADSSHGSVSSVSSQNSLTSDEFYDCADTTVATASVQQAIPALQTVFNNESKALWLRNAKDLFWNYIETPQKQLIAIFARENIKLNGQKLTVDEHSGINIADMLNQLEAKYPNNSLDNVSDDSGYTFCGHGHPFLKLELMGFERSFLEAMSLSDAIIYESALSTAESSAGHEEAYHLFTTSNEFFGEEEAQATKHAFIAELTRYLKVQIEEAHRMKLRNEAAEVNLGAVGAYPEEGVLESLQQQVARLQLEKTQLIETLQLQITQYQREKEEEAEQRLAHEGSNNVMTKELRLQIAELKREQVVATEALQHQATLHQQEKSELLRPLEAHIENLQREKELATEALQQQATLHQQEKSELLRPLEAQIENLQREKELATEALQQQATLHQQEKSELLRPLEAHIENLQREKELATEALQQQATLHQQEEAELLRPLEAQIVNLQREKEVAIEALQHQITQLQREKDEIAAPLLQQVVQLQQEKEDPIQMHSQQTQTTASPRSQSSPRPCNRFCVTTQLYKICNSVFKLNNKTI